MSRLFSILGSLRSSAVLVAGCAVAPGTSQQLPALHILSSRLTNLQFGRQPGQVRAISTSSPSYLKEIQKTVQGNLTTVEGIYVDSSHEKHLVKNELKDKHVCPLCYLNLNLKHTDVLVLSQFVRPDGRILPRRVTGLCCSQQYKITMLITMSKKAGLMPNLAPLNSHNDPSRRRGTKKLHRFFDDHTVSDTRLRNILHYKAIPYRK